MEPERTAHMSGKIKPVIICLLFYLMLSGMLNGFVGRYAKIYLPVVPAILSLLYPDYFEFRMPKFDTEDHKIKFKACLKGGVKMGDRYVQAEYISRFCCSGSFLVLYPAITFSLLIAWPIISRDVRIISLIVASLLVYCMTVMDLSLFMMSTMESHIQIGTVSQKIRKFLVQFFSTGGRQFFSIIIAWVALSIAQWGVTPDHQP